MIRVSRCRCHVSSDELYVNWDFGLLLFLHFVTPSFLFLLLTKDVFDGVECFSLFSIELFVVANGFFRQLQSFMSCLLRYGHTAQFPCVIWHIGGSQRLVGAPTLARHLLILQH